MGPPAWKGPSEPAPTAPLASRREAHWRFSTMLTHFLQVAELVISVFVMLAILAALMGGWRAFTLFFGIGAPSSQRSNSNNCCDDQQCKDREVARIEREEREEKEAEQNAARRVRSLKRTKAARTNRERLETEEQTLI